jgi:hypothetical protein
MKALALGKSQQIKAAEKINKLKSNNNFGPHPP